MDNLPVPTTSPVQVAPETFLIPNLAPAGAGDVYLPVNSLLIRGEEPIVVDTGAPVHREHWLEMVFGLVDPEDIRWVFLSHEDGDHIGALDTVLEAAPQATLVMNFFSTERRALETPVPSSGRSGGSRASTSTPATVACASCCRRSSTAPPPAASTTRRPACCGRSTRFAALTTGAVHHVEDLPRDLYDETFMLFNSLVSPWHQWLDPVRYDAPRRHRRGAGAAGRRQRPRPDPRRRRHPRRLRPGAHPRRRAPIIAPPGQEVLDEILAAVISAARRLSVPHPPPPQRSTTMSPTRPRRRLALALTLGVVLMLGATAPAGAAKSPKLTVDQPRRVVPPPDRLVRGRARLGRGAVRQADLHRRLCSPTSDPTTRPCRPPGVRARLGPGVGRGRHRPARHHWRR